jgi:hypothetical protein
LDRTIFGNCSSAAKAASEATTWLPTVLAAAAVGLAPAWWHLDLVDPGIDNITAVFGEVAIYPSDVCLAALAVLAIARPAPLRHQARWLAYGLTLLACVALFSALPSTDPTLGAALAGHLGLLALAWLGVYAGRVSCTAVVVALVVPAVAQSLLGVAQFGLQQPLVPSALHLPWLPSDVSEGGTPVVLGAAGDRLLRGFGTFPHPNILGGYLALALVCLPVLANSWPRRWPVWWLVGAVLAAGLLASFSRAGWLAASVGLGAWWWSSHRRGHARWRLLGVVPVTVAVIAISPLAPTIAPRLFPLGPDSNPLERGSVENRLALDRSALSEGFHHLPLGVGGGNYGLVALADGYQEGWGEPAPNLALLIGAELGLPGIVAASLVVLGTIRAVRVGSGRDVAALAACLAIAMLAMVDHYLWTMPLGRVIAWTPLALVAALGAANYPVSKNDSAP